MRRRRIPTPMFIDCQMIDEFLKSKSMNFFVEWCTSKLEMIIPSVEPDNRNKVLSK